MPGAPERSPGRWSFVLKVALAVALASLANWLFLFEDIGWTLGLFALALLLAVVIARPATRNSRRALPGLAGAGAAALLLIDDPSLLAWSLFWIGLAIAVLLPLHARFDHAGRWAMRLFVHGLLAAVAPLFDLTKLRRARRRAKPIALPHAIGLVALPLVGTIVFLLLFAEANPLIGDVVGRIDLAMLFGGLSLFSTGLWLMTFITAWSLLRPNHLFRLASTTEAAVAKPLPGVTRASMLLSLAAFNAVFLLQNGLDAAFLWSGAPLPKGVTLADYAHRGAYPLIATALLAAMFVLITLRPGGALSDDKVIRRLLALWIAQNIFLVASSILRTLDYIDAYSLTRLRIAALMWMVLVAVGLALICWRVLRDRSAAWLINMNCAAALAVLAIAATVDLGAVAASWNVRHAREAGGRGAALDLCYLGGLGSSALVPLAELEARAEDPALRDRVGWLRNLTMDRLEPLQDDWHGWTFRNHRRLEHARALIAANDLPRRSARPRSCTGAPNPTPPPPPSPLPATPSR